ncbi:hypothetical protein OG949_40575 (plasmid) [Streptomyces scopuliridis]|uniref:hypothetical protein n=1 Tax=Streptomyces scopuliridis TaxID=452529 RepID=UPI002DDBCE8F|nr:hypothetical protein [Streptomyces scopuliridis]WSB39054.1 hypothetical protein OG949_40575 [Streptomyces scopuliridis]
MHDPASPSSSPEPADAPGYQDASDALTQVITWYSQQLLAERRSPAPDPGRLNRLIAEHGECVRDRARLEDAAPAELARITALYAARLKELEATGP